MNKQRYYERRYHATWMLKSGPSALAALGAWMVQHRARLESSPRGLLIEAATDVAGRLPRVAAREPTRRHRKHFAWLLSWQARLSAAIKARDSLEGIS